MSVNNRNTSASKIYPNINDNYEMSKSDNSLNANSDENSRSTSRDRVFQTFFDLIAIVIVFVVFALVYFLVSPSIAYFYCNDTDINYPYKPDTVELWVVGLYGTLGPAIFILIVELRNSRIISCSNDEKKQVLGKRSELILFAYFMRYLYLHSVLRLLC